MITMRRRSNVADTPDHRRERESGQVLAIGATLVLGLIMMAALVLEGGNAFAQQRVTQNGADAAANAGAVVLAENLGGATWGDGVVLSRVTAIAGSNNITAFVAEYTNFAGQLLDVSGAVTSSSGNPAAQVGGGTIPPGARGVHFGGDRTFGTFIANAVGVSTLKASADATAITGPLNGGAFLPIIFPVAISVCDGSGSTQPFTRDQWTTSNPPAGAGGYPVGPEYIVPLCKTNGPGGAGGGGSFQILDLDPNLTCLEEAQNPPLIYWPSFPVDVAVDNGNNCAKPLADEINANLHLKPVIIPICDAQCIPSGNGSGAVYHVIGITAFYIDYVFDQNGGNNSSCQGGTGSGGDPLINVIGGNGSSSCVHGWFIQIITAGPVGSGPVGDTDAIGVQLIK